MENGATDTDLGGSAVSRDTVGATGPAAQAEASAKSELNLATRTLPQLRTKGEREEFIAALALGVMPDRVDPERWQRWLSGESGPYETPTSKRPATHGQSLARDLARQSKSVDRAVHAVTKERETLARAQGRVADAEAALVKARADDQATLLAAVRDTLRAELAPVFAMGPAWTVLRALSGTLSPAQLEDELRLERNPDKRSALEKEVREERKAETKEIFTTLRAWAGDREFEEELREAICKVVKSRRDIDPPRSLSEVAEFERLNALPGDITRDRNETLAGLT